MRTIYKIQIQIILQLDTSQVRLQLDFLSGLLDLPPSTRTVGTLSGGQQRRVSFAVSLLHSPDLMILDEPTVGVICQTQKLLD